MTTSFESYKLLIGQNLTIDAYTVVCLLVSVPLKWCKNMVT